MTDGTGTNAATAMEERLKGLFADTLGMRFVEVTPERVRAELDVREELCTVPGIMHGGAIMAFADTLGGGEQRLLHAGVGLVRGPGAVEAGAGVL